MLTRKYLNYTGRDVIAIRETCPGAVPYLEPGEQIQSIFLAQSGPSPYWILLSIWIVVFSAGYSTVVVTDRAIVILRNVRFVGTRAKALRMRGTRNVWLGQPQGPWGSIQLDRKYWVHKRFHKDVAAADNALRAMQPHGAGAPGYPALAAGRSQLPDAAGPDRAIPADRQPRLAGRVDHRTGQRPLDEPEQPTASTAIASTATDTDRARTPTPSTGRGGRHRRHRLGDVNPRRSVNSHIRDKRYGTPSGKSALFAADPTGRAPAPAGRAGQPVRSITRSISASNPARAGTAGRSSSIARAVSA
jgi:hypothetical protein